jgi:hypothetical protein
MKEEIVACICMVLGITLHGMESKDKSGHNLALYKQLNPTVHADAMPVACESFEYIMQNLWNDNIDVNDPEMRDRIKNAFIAEQAKLNVYFSKEETKRILSDDKRMSEITLSEKNDFVARLLSVNPDEEYDQK